MIYRKEVRIQLVRGSIDLGFHGFEIQLISDPIAVKLKWIESHPVEIHLD